MRFRGGIFPLLAVFLMLAGGMETSASESSEMVTVTIHVETAYESNITGHLDNKTWGVRPDPLEEPNEGAPIPPGRWYADSEQHTVRVQIWTPGQYQRTVSDRFSAREGYSGKGDISKLEVGDTVTIENEPADVPLGEDGSTHFRVKVNSTQERWVTIKGGGLLWNSQYCKGTTVFSGVYDPLKLNQTVLSGNDSIEWQSAYGMYCMEGEAGWWHRHIPLPATSMLLVLLLFSLAWARRPRQPF